MKIERIMVPVDGSDTSRRAAQYAAELAKNLGAQVMVLHCHKPFPVILGEPYFQTAHNKIMDYVRELMIPYLELFEENGIPCVERILEGRPHEMIVEAATIEKTDLIIMGSRGRTDFEGLLLGSVTHRVLHSAPCPVMVIR